jgi:hypothetical protein
MQSRWCQGHSWLDKKEGNWNILKEANAHSSNEQNALDNDSNYEFKPFAEIQKYKMSPEAAFPFLFMSIQLM